MTAQIAEDSISPPTGTDVTLCEKCHTWNDVAFLSSKAQSGDYYESHTVDILLDATCPDCAICGVVYTAAKTRLDWEKSEGRIYAKSLVARNLGPLYMDNEYTPGDRVDDSQPGESRLFLAIYIEVHEPAEPSLAREPATANSPAHKPEPCEDTASQEVHKMAPRFRLRHTKDIPTGLSGVEPWESPFFDVNLLKNWLSACECIHSMDPSSMPTLNNTDDMLPVDFRLIDTQSMNVVMPSPGEPYIALSYMWQIASSGQEIGQLDKANLHSLEAVNGLENVSLPNVISDTIALCRALGERYLWVDRFCIVQDDEVSKNGQIRAMDIVYSSAKLTIMAALNKYKTSVGLSGCPKLASCPGRPRLPSAMDPWLRFNGEERSIHPGFDGSDDSVNSSTWNSRAWTFQERFLSRCRLFITESQAIFQCNGGEYSAFEHLARTEQKLHGAAESSCGEARDISTVKLTMNSTNHGRGEFQHSTKFLGRNNVRLSIDSIASLGLRSRSFTVYRSLIYEYTRRQLSFRSDILNAFTGIGNVLARGFETRILFGLPERYFCFALRWNMPLRRYLADWEAGNVPAYAPSWSWASTHCFKGYNSWSIADMDVNLIHYYFYVSGPSNLAQTLRKIDARTEYEPGHPVLGHSPFQESLTQVPTVLDQPACEVARKLQGSLIFNTATVFCHLGPREKSMSGGHPDSERLFCQALIAPPSGKSMGRADVDCKWTEETRYRVGDEIKLVVIAVHEKPFNHSGRGPAQKLEVLDVLLVEPSPRDTLALRRTGVGYVTDWKLWQSCNPQWETVVLC